MRPLESGYRLARDPRRPPPRLSQADLAERAGVHETTIWRTEKNPMAPSLAQLVAIARELGTPMYALFKIADG